MIDDYEEMHHLAHRDALIYGYGFLVVNRAGALTHIAPQYIETLLAKVDENLEDMDIEPS